MANLRKGLLGVVAASVAAGLGCAVVTVPDHARAVPSVLGATERALATRARRALGGEHAERPLHAGVTAARAVAGGAFDLLPAAEATLEPLALGEVGAAGSGRYAAHVYGRLLNARASVLDLSRARTHAAVYDRLAAGSKTASDRLVYGVLGRLARAQQALSGGRRLAALRHVRAAERAMARYLAAHPEDEDVRTLYATHMVTMAAFLPVGRRRRLRRAAEALAHQQAHWAELSPRARNRAVAPGVRTVFAWWWAQSEAALGRTRRAQRAYAQVVASLGPTPTVAQAQLAAAARAAGRGETVPAIRPIGRAACVACHARTTPIPGFAGGGAR